MKNENDNSEIGKMLKKVKATFLDVVVREWLNTPQKSWSNKSPLQMIKSGEGQKVLDVLKQAEDELTKERNGNSKNISPEKSIE